MGVHPGLDQRIQRAVDHRRRATGVHVQRLEIGKVFANGFMQHAAAPLPSALIANDFVQEQIGQLQPFVPMLDLIKVFGTTHPPIQMHRMLEAGGATMFDQAVDLAHAGACGNQYQWAVRQFGQVRVAERHVDPHHRVALQLLDQV